MKIFGYKKGSKFLLEVAPIGNGHYLEIAAARDFLRMDADADAVGVTLHVNTAFRTNEEQIILYDAYIAWPGLPIEEKAHRKKPAMAAAPGHSTHQSGISVDINRAPGDDPRTAKPDSPIDLWLAGNAHKYGFHNDVVGEPWHWTHLPDVRLVVIA